MARLKLSMCACVCVCVYAFVRVCVWQSAHVHAMINWRLLAEWCSQEGVDANDLQVHARGGHTRRACEFSSQQVSHESDSFFHWHTLFLDNVSWCMQKTQTIQNHSDEYRCELSRTEWPTVESVSKCTLCGLSNHHNLSHIIHGRSSAVRLMPEL